MLLILLFKEYGLNKLGKILYNDKNVGMIASVSCSWWAVRTSNPEDAAVHSGSIPPPVCFYIYMQVKAIFILICENNYFSTNFMFNTFNTYL